MPLQYHPGNCLIDLPQNYFSIWYAMEKEMATHSSILAWKIPWTEGPGRLQSMGLQESDTTEQLNHHDHGI